MKVVRIAYCTLLVALTGCDQGGASRFGPAPLSAVFDVKDTTSGPLVVVLGFSRDELSALRSAATQYTDSAWQALVRVSVHDSTKARDVPPVAGRYVVTDSAVEFQPRFSFDAGRTYLVMLDARHLPTPRAEAPVRVLLAELAGDRTPRTFVRAMYPGGDTLPENLLRIYIEFSAPMSRTSGLDYISLRDDSGKEVPAAFLPLDADFWNGERTRFTAFLDPGRVKQGILPNEQMGRAIRAGRRYTMVVDSAWRDERGVPLTATFRRSFHVAKADEAIVDIRQWRLEAPTSGTKAALTVRFPKSLDHGLLARALGVERADGAAVDGDVILGAHDTEWRFTPRAAWRGGDYKLVVLSILEDPAGNRTDKPFEVDVFDRVDKTSTPDRQTLAFTVR